MELETVLGCTSLLPQPQYQASAPLGNALVIGASAAVDVGVDVDPFEMAPGGLPGVEPDCALGTPLFIESLDFDALLPDVTACPGPGDAVSSLGQLHGEAYGHGAVAGGRRPIKIESEDGDGALPLGGARKQGRGRGGRAARPAPAGTPPGQLQRPDHPKAKKHCRVTSPGLGAEVEVKAEPATPTGPAPSTAGTRSKRQQPAPSPASGASAAGGAASTRPKRQRRAKVLSMDSPTTDPDSTEEDKVGRRSSDPDERKYRRMMKNRRSAAVSRQRRKEYVEELEQKVELLRAENRGLKSAPPPDRTRQTSAARAKAADRSGSDCHTGALRSAIEKDLAVTRARLAEVEVENRALREQLAMRTDRMAGALARNLAAPSPTGIDDMSALHFNGAWSTAV